MEATTAAAATIIITTAATNSKHLATIKKVWNTWL